MRKRFLAILVAIGLILALSSCSLPGTGGVVTIDGQTITSPTTWTKDNLYYVKSWVVFTSSLTIEPGTIIAFGTASGASGNLTVEGQLTAVGTSTEPIVFTSVKEGFAGYTIPGVTGTPAVGDWDYIWIKGASSKLQYCQVRYCTQGVEVAANSVMVQNDTFTNNTIGLDARSAGSGFVVGNNTFYGNTHPFYADRNFSIDDSNTFQNGSGSIKNTYQAIEFDSGYINSNITWSCTTVAYAVPLGNGWLSISSGYTLTLGTGAVLKFGLGTDNGLTVQTSAGLGNHTNAVFTSIRDDSLGGDSNGDSTATSPAASDWGGIYSDGGSSWYSGAFLHYSQHP
jgi:hypothetical protein